MQDRISGAVRIGTAGWALPRDLRDAFPGEGSVLARYAARLDAVEINSSFYRPHRPQTYARWASSVPADFRFAVKVPKSATHDRRLVGCDAILTRFADEVAALGTARGPLLVQLPPALTFDAAVADAFFATLHARAGGDIVCEPRHASWFTATGDAFLRERRIARVAADPAVARDAGEPGGWQGLLYLRLHGAPRTYYSDYAPEALAGIARRLTASCAVGIPAWCIFDNTALGHALSNALAVADSLGRAPRRPLTSPASPVLK